MDRERHAGRPGEVLDVFGNGLLVAAPGGRLRLGQIRLRDQLLEHDDLVGLGARPGLILG
jgi:hypothetical protein